MSEPRQWLTADVLVEADTWSAVAELDTIVATVVDALWRDQPRPDGPRLDVALPPLLATIVFESAAEVRRLNREFRQQDKSTNVLSFNAPPLPASVPVSATEPRHIGDIVLAAETVLAEAKTLDITPAAHVHHLVLHGLLHLLGYDHETATDAARMEALETRLLGYLGIADPYAGTELV